MYDELTSTCPQDDNKRRHRRRLYFTSGGHGFTIVSDTNQSVPYERKFLDLLHYMWYYMPSGILKLFAEWLVCALAESGVRVTKDQIDTALSNMLRKYEKHMSGERKARLGRKRETRNQAKS